MKPKSGIFLLSGILFLSLLLSCSSSSQKAETIDSESMMLQAEHRAYTDVSTKTDGLEIDHPAFSQYLYKNRLEDTPLLVFLYSVNDCKYCLDEVVEALGKHISDMKNNKRVLFLASEVRDSYRPEYGNTVMLKRGEKLALPYADATPMMFVYQNGIRHCFFPTGLFVDSFEIYLENVISRYGIGGLEGTTMYLKGL